MRRIRRLLIRRVPIGFGTPLIRCSGSSRWNTRRTGWTTWTGSVVGSPLLLGSLRGILTTVLTSTSLPSAGIHLRSLLVGWVRLLVLLKIGMPSRLVRLIWPVVVRLLWWLRCRWISLALGNGRWRLLSGCAAYRWLTSSTRWSGRGCLRRSGTNWRRLLSVGSLLWRWRVWATAIASVRIGGCRWS